MTASAMVAIVPVTDSIAVFGELSAEITPADASSASYDFWHSATVVPTATFW